MRKLVWFGLGFAGASAVWAYLLPGNGLLLLGLGAGAGLFLAVLLSRRVREARFAAWLLLGCAIGSAWCWGYDQIYLAPARSLEGRTASAQMEITDYSYETRYGKAADGAVTLDGKPYRVRIYYSGEEDLAPGDLLRGSFRFQTTVPDAGEEISYQSGKGIFLLAYAQGTPDKIAGEEVPLYSRPAVLRRGILELIDRIFPAGVAPFIRGLLLGDTGGLSYEENTAFRLSGIRHIVAVSGLHVSILFSLICLFTRKRRVLTAVVGIPTLILFAAVAGFTPSVTRACVMSGLTLLAMLLGQEYDPPTALAAAVVGMLAFNPMTVTNISFQLSVGCMAGIFLFAQPLRAWLTEHLGGEGKTLRARLVRWLAGGVSVTLGAMAVTTPLSAAYFGAVSLVGPVTNLLCLWAVNLLFYAAMLSCVLGWLFLPAGRALAWLAAWLARYVLGAARVLAAFPLAAVYTVNPYAVIWLAGCYILLGIFLLLPRKKPLLFSCLGIAGLCAALLVSWFLPRLDDFRLTVLDVGQGQCLLFQSEGKTYLVDCGGDNAQDAADLAADTLLSQGVRRLDGVILTHFDADHAAGLPYLLTRIPADILFLPEEDPGYGAGRSSLTVERSYQISYSNTLISLISGDPALSDNDGSLCVLFQTAGTDILVTGDRSAAGEAALMEKIALPELEVLIVGHHGSKTSTSLDLLEATHPKVAVISVGADNSYGHPAPEILDRLAQFGCTVYRTDEDGTIIYRG